MSLLPRAQPEPMATLRLPLTGRKKGGRQLQSKGTSKAARAKRTVRCSAVSYDGGLVVMGCDDGSVYVAELQG